MKKAQKKIEGAAPFSPAVRVGGKPLSQWQLLESENRPVEKEGAAPNITTRKMAHGELHELECVIYGDGKYGNLGKVLPREAMEALHPEDRQELALEVRHKYCFDTLVGMYGNDALDFSKLTAQQAYEVAMDMARWASSKEDAMGEGRKAWKDGIAKLQPEAYRKTVLECISSFDTQMLDAALAAQAGKFGRLGEYEMKDVRMWAECERLNNASEKFATAGTLSRFHPRDIPKIANAFVMGGSNRGIAVVRSMYANREVDRWKLFRAIWKGAADREFRRSGENETSFIAAGTALAAAAAVGGVLLAANAMHATQLETWLALLGFSPVWGAIAYAAGICLGFGAKTLSVRAKTFRPEWKGMKEAVAAAKEGNKEGNDAA